MYTKAYEGHVQQYSAQKTTDVPIAKEGMYYKEFPSQFDWQHNGEGPHRLQPDAAGRPL
jgi:hypothetical protein